MKDITKKACETRPVSKIISIDEGEIRNHLDQMVKKSVEDTLNSLLDAEADALCKATRYVRYSRFFQPVDLVFQLADLAVKFRFSLLRVSVSSSFLFEKTSGRFWRKVFFHWVTWFG